MVCKNFKHCTSASSHREKCSSDIEKFSDRYDMTSNSLITATQGEKVMKYKICTSTLTDSDIAAIFFAIAFIILALGLAAFAWWSVDR